MISRLIPGLACLLPLCLTACQPAQEAALPGADQLLARAFPGWRENGRPQVRDVDLGPQTAPAKRRMADTHLVPAQLTPLGVVSLDAGHLAVLTETVPLDDYDQPQTGHAFGAHLGVYFFRREGTDWVLEKRLDSAHQQGAGGTLGSVRWQTEASLGPLVSLSWGSCWQGYCGSWLSLVQLAPGQVRVLADNLPTHADNSGSGELCDALSREEAPPEDDEAPVPPSCFGIHSEWKISGEGLRLQFGGWQHDTPASAHRRENIREDALYTLQNGRFRLREGRNPVPAF